MHRMSALLFLTRHPLWMSAAMGAIASGWVTACTASSSPPPVLEQRAVTLDETIRIAAGQTVYVPVYSHMYMLSQDRSINLTATLSIRNTDQSEPIIVASADYYNSSGTLVRNYLEQPIELEPLSSTEFVIDQDDVSGGVGASFLVEWIAEADVSDPVIEAIMINTSGNQGISFVSQGRVINQR